MMVERYHVEALSRDSFDGALAIEDKSDVVAVTIQLPLDKPTKRLVLIDVKQPDPFEAHVTKSRAVERRKGIAPAAKSLGQSSRS